jgi:ancient ubiquitous protein 1
METDNLYDKSIYPNDLTSILILIFYLPIGVCLLIIRLIIILILLLTNNLNNSSILCKTLGLSISSSLSIRKEEEEEEEKERIVLISNHVTLFDYLVLKKIIKNLNIHEKNYNYEKNCYLNKILLSRIETMKKKKDDDCSLCVFPEIKMTNGKYGLLDFNKDIIESIINSKQFDRLIPVCLKVNHHHLLPFSVNYNNSSTIQFLITLFSPSISYKIELLNSIKLNDNQHNGQELSKELQKIIALNLGLKCFNNPLNEEDYHTSKLIRQISDILPDF